MAKKILFLQLSPEFGSTKFGPFQGAEIRLGSEPSRNDIVLPEALGVSPEHAKVVKQQGDETFLVAPVDRTSQVFVHRKDGRAPKQITAPLALTDGDGFSLVSAEGPKFLIVLEHPKQAEKQDLAPKGGLGKAAKRLTAKSLQDEIKRLGFAKAITSSAGGTAYRAFTFIKSGAWLQPRYIVMGIMLLSGYLFAGSIGCGMAGLGWQHSKQGDELVTCQDKLAAYEGGPGEDQGDTINSMTEKILGPAGKEIRSLLEKDDELSQLYRAELKAILDRKEDYQWVKDKNSPLAAYQKVLAKSSSFDEPLVRVFTYAAAHPGDPSDIKLYRVDDDPEKAPPLNFTCYRGPLALSWRQARRFEFSETRIDAPIDQSVAEQGAREALEGALEAESKLIGKLDEVDLAEGDGIAIDGVVHENLQCVFAEGADGRDNAGDLPGNLKDAIGKKARGLPAAGSGNYVANRVLKYYAADWQRGWKDMKFDDTKKNVTAQLQAADGATDPAKERTKQQVATLLARAAMVPCVGVMGRDKEPPEWMLKDAAVIGGKSKVNCAIFAFLVEEESGG